MAAPPHGPRRRAVGFQQRLPPPGVAKPGSWGCYCCSGRQSLSPVATAAAADAPPELPAVAKLSGRVCRVLGRNPSSFTLTGTNLYLVGTGARRILVDAGEGKEGVVEDLLGVMEEEGCVGLSEIVITHWHHDHLMGVPELQRRFGPVPVRKYLPLEGAAKGEQGPKSLGAHFDPEEWLQGAEVVGLADDDVLRCEGASLRVLFTPGHANDHVCLMLEEEKALFTGDNVLGWGTGTFQNLQLYLSSLRRMRDATPELLYPAHGPVVEKERTGPWLQMYVSHREERIEQVAAALRGAPPGGASLQNLTREVYREQPSVLAHPVLFPAACNNTRLVLDYLLREGQCEARASADGDLYAPRAARL